MAAQQDAGWYNDPTGRYTNRYWDGVQWTDSVNSGGANSVDPVPSGEVLAPPAPGTAARVAAAPAQPAAINVSAQSGRGGGGGSSMGLIIGALAVVVVALIVVVIVANNNDSGDEPTDTTEAPVQTDPPAETEPPADGDGG